MIHNFFIIKYDEIPHDSRNYELIKVKNSIKVHDDIIVNNELFLDGFQSYKVSFDNPSKGLDYHGITIIPPSSLEDFLTNVIKAKDIKVIPEEVFKGPDGVFIKSKAVKIKPKIQAQLDELIALCKQAIDKKMYLIHFGL